MLWYNYSIIISYKFNITSGHVCIELINTNFEVKLSDRSFDDYPTASPTHRRIDRAEQIKYNISIVQNISNVW